MTIDINFLTFPEQENILPWHNEAENWTMGKNFSGNNSFFRTQPVECSYPISSSYASTPRYIFYALVFVSILARKATWVTSVALSSVMTYSSVAAIHAFVLVTLRKKIVPNVLFNHQWEVALIEGIAPNGRFEDRYQDGALWLPILPMAWDADAIPVLAIVGTAFLVLLPMQSWSSTLKASKAKVVVVLWGCLLTAAFVCALVNATYLYRWVFPQFRICPLDHQDALPLVNEGHYPYAGLREPGDRYRWNRTIQDYFVSKTSRTRLPNICIYPCFEFEWPLRDPIDINVSSPFSGPIFADAATVLFVVAFVLVISSASFGITIAIIKNLPGDWRKISYKWLIQKGYEIANSEKVPIQTRFAKFLLIGWILIAYLYTNICSLPALLVLMGYIEFVMWRATPGGETIRHIGQWGALAAIVLMIVSALIYYLVSRSVPKQQGSRQWWRH